MLNIYYQPVLQQLEKTFGQLRRMGTGYTLYHIPSIDVVVYLRYSKTFKKGQNITHGFFGLRHEDICLMQQKISFICLITNDASKNLFIPFRQFENYFLSVEPSKDGQYKTLSVFKPTGAEVYFAGIGKFTAENYRSIDSILNISKSQIALPALSHTQIQSIIGSIGIIKGFDVWYPENDKQKVDTGIVDASHIRGSLPSFGKEIDHIISEIDVIWLKQATPVSFYEVEHSTPIYSGLLRFNDVLLSIAHADNFNIVANSERETKFTREINRPTFKHNKLIDKVTFLNYTNVFSWYHDLTGVYYGV